MDETEIIPENEKPFPAIFTNISLPPSPLEDKSLSARRTKLPLSELSSWGVAFEPISSAIQSVFSSTGTTSMLAKVTIPSGTHLANLKNGMGNIGTYMTSNNQIAGQAVINPLVCNPTMIFMAVTLANISKKLDAIQETQQEILSFLSEKEKSELRGNVHFLFDILENYQFNWNNDKFKNANHIKVLDIRQKSEQSIDFYRKQINSRLSRKGLLVSDLSVKAKLDKVREDLKDYLLSVYLYSFSSYLEVMLLENFNQVFLSKIADKIEAYSIEYRELYTTAYNMLEGESKTSVQSLLLQGLSIAGKETGKFLHQVPLISKTAIDEALVSGGNALSGIQQKQRKTMMSSLIDRQIDCVKPFADQIRTIGRLFNQDMELIFDKEAIYLPE